MRIVLGLLGLFVILIVAFFISQNMLGSSFFGPNSEVTVNEHTYKVTIAKSEKDRGIGLSSKTSLNDNIGMVFLFDKPDYYPFWMKNMKFPIDIIFIHDKKIVTIYKNVPNPKSDTDALPLYQPTEPANIVLELKAGQTDKNNIKTGDVITTKNIAF